MPTLSQGARLSLKNILFPTDFSSASNAALPFALALALARAYESTLLLTHAVAAEPHRQVVTDRVPAQDNRVWHEARQKLADITPLLGSMPFKTVLEQGDLGDVIPEVIREYEADLVVLGTHGRRGVSKLVLGSNAEKIYRLASCPVLTIGPSVVAASDWKIRKILCPVDTAEDPTAVLRYSLSLAEENQGELVILQAIPLVPWQHRAAVEVRSRRSLEALMPSDARDWCTLDYLIRWEHPVEAILHAARECNADLIVMSVHKSRISTLATHLPWPVASEVVSRAACPVLTVRV